MSERVRRSSMSSREEERIIDEYRKRFEDKVSKKKSSFSSHTRVKSRSKVVSPYLQSVAPRNLTTIPSIPKRPRSATVRIRPNYKTEDHIEKLSKAVGTQSIAEDDLSCNYSSSFTSSDSDDSNEKENYPEIKTEANKSFPRNRPTSAPAHRRRHTHDATVDSDSLNSYEKRNIPVYQRQPYTIRCRAFKNGSHQDGVTVVAPNIKQLLIEATRKLGLNTAGRRVYLEDGMEAFIPKDIPYNAKVYISNGETFKDPRKSLRYSGGLMQSSSWTSKGVVLESERKPRRRTASNRLRRLAGMQSFRILVFTNGNGAESQEVVHGSQDKYHKLLDQCTSKLKMNSAARITYGWDGKEVSSLQEVQLLDSCMKDGSALIHGPLWISSGEGFNPVGASNFIEGILWGIKKRLESAEVKMEQLEYACNGEMSKVHDKDIVNMPMDDVYETIDQVSQDVEEMKSAKKKYEDRLKVVKKMMKDQQYAGNAYTMKHIKEIKSDDRIVGQHGLRLRIFENGKDVNPQTVFVNMREILRGAEQEQNPEKLIRQRFLEYISHWHKPLDPSGPAKSTLVRRMFDKDGEEITNVKELEHDQPIWLSYGEDYKPCYVMALHVQLQPVTGYILNGKDKVIARKGGVEFAQKTTWELCEGFPENVTCFSVSSIGQQPEKYLPSDHYLQAKDDPDLVVKPLLMADKKLEKRTMPGMSQSWLVHRNGLITSRSYPQISLALDEDEPITVEMSCGATVTGYALTLQKRVPGKSVQQWEFSSSGHICSLYNPSSNLVVTMLDHENFNSVEVKGERIALNSSKDDNENALASSHPNGQIRVAVLEKLTGSRAKLQRWALKQESVPNQWKCTKVANPAWKKLAYSWPVLPDGNWNMDYKWPMEGTFICSPPHLRGRGKSGASTTVPLRVYINGEKDPKRFATVVVPDLSGSSLSNDKSVDDAESAVIQLEMNMFLEKATSLLNLPFAARRIFNVHGREVFSLRKLRRNDTVFVTCGEAWKNPTVTKSEIQKRQLLTKLGADVKKIHEYCVLRNTGELVVSMESGIVAGSRLVVTQRIGKDLPEDDGIKVCKETEEKKESPEEEAQDFKTSHEKSHAASNSWYTARKYPWQHETMHAEEKDKIEEAHPEKSPRTPRSRSRSPRVQIKSPRLLQKFVVNKDGFICPEDNAALAFGVSGLGVETFAGTLEVCLCKKDPDDLTQRWDVRKDGTIRPLCDSSAGLTVCLPPISNDEERSPKSYVVLLQKLKPFSIGSANQKWHMDQKNGLLRAFYTSVADKEVTAANHVSVCTYAVRGPERLNQDGYIVEMKGSLRSNPVMVCQSCASVMRGGKYPLTHAPTNWSFICSMGDPKKHGLKLQGSFKCLNGKIDLSTYEAEPTLNHWVSQLRRLRQETSMRTISQEMNNVEYTQAWRLLIRKNGCGYQSKPEMVIGSSVTGVLDQCSQKLHLSSAARRLYTEDGTHILHMDQLKQWVEQGNRKTSIIQQIEQVHDKGSDAGRHRPDSNDEKHAKQTDGNNSTEGTPDHSTTEYGTQDLTRKSDRKNQLSLSQAVTEQLMEEQQQLSVVEIWVSSGENFINPVIADKLTQESIVAHMEKNALNLEIDTQRHVIRQMHGRRRGHMQPAELIPTKDVNQPVLVKGGWTTATKEEHERLEMYNDMKEIQKPKRPKSAVKLQGSLYRQPQIKRITVSATNDLSKSVYAWGESLEALLNDVASKLEVRKIERAFFTEDGKRIRSFSDIERNAELYVNPRRPGSTIRMKTSWARTRKIHGPEATEIVITGPRNDKKIAYVPPTNQVVYPGTSSSSSSSSSSDSDDE